MASILSPVMYMPIVQGIPLDQPDGRYKGSGLNSGVYSILNAASDLTIRQHVQYLPKNCCACPPCVKQENIYSIYAGIPQTAGAAQSVEILRVEEKSDDWNRCCCAPNHPLALEMKEFVPFPGDETLTNEQSFAWLTEDFKQNWNVATKRQDKAKIRKQFYESQLPALTMLREDGMRCCCKQNTCFPCRWLTTFVCFDCCEDGMNLYAGGLEYPANEKGRIPKSQHIQNELLGSVHQPTYGGWCTPTLHLREAGAMTDKPYGKVEGPLCFGGWSEFCCDFKFFVSNMDSKKKSGDLALITKKKPVGLSGAAADLFTNADVYTVQFDPNAKLTPEQKVTMLGSQLLADYMFFDGNTQKCEIDSKGNIWCYIFYCSCIGLLVPCKFMIPTGQN